MAIMKISKSGLLKEVHPKVDKDLEVCEPINDYCKRMANILPNFPAEILMQWFHRHPQVIEKYRWLDYKSLQFQKVEWQTNQILEVLCQGIEETYGAIRNHVAHYKDGSIGPNLESIIRYMREFGTWPVAPVFLDNHDGLLKWPNGWKVVQPYELLEGHRRCAAMLILRDENIMNATHKLWVAIKEC